MKAFVTGGAGFIGSNLAGELVRKKHSVTCYDNLSLGRKEFLRPYLGYRSFRFLKADLLDFGRLKKAIKGHDVVFHMAANSDIGYGIEYTDWDLKQGTLATFNVLEAMRVNGIKEIVFASTSAVYGDEPRLRPTPEDYGPLFPISLYGASKLASEGLISAYCHNFGMRAWIFRFGNVVGDNGTHGVVVDFITRLRKNSKELRILGDGKQSKPYLYVKECVDGILFGHKHSRREVNFFNLASKGATSVSKIADMVTGEMGLAKVKRRYTGTKRGWPGDVPQVRLNTAKMTRLGWKASLSSDRAVLAAIRALLRDRRFK
ncbi:MAG: NAD-dependent epimerase/dehydratase family protein [Candidatus Omnitrophica bacterium]|nr:NAD-dependent epimerase/dehydratase family protein [Candidatus Omnitrophota bacterium]